MAYVPDEVHHHYSEGQGSGAGFWAVVAVLAVLLLLLLFGSNLFSRSGDRGNDINIRGSIETPGTSGTGGTQ